MRYIIACMLLCVCVCRSVPYGKVAPRVQDDNHWSYLILSQFWPESSCIYFEEKGGDCLIPPNVKGWTIHGLWPSRPDSTEFPHNCNDSMVFNMAEIEVLRPRLDLEWHYYNKKGDRSFLWNHEWTKHGTCAFSLPDLRGELKYFNKTLELHSHVNLTEALANSQILPSHTTTHKMEDFFNAVQKYYKVKPFIVCDYDKQTKKTYLDQIYLCYTKTFDLQDCYPTPSTSVDASGSKVIHASSYYQGCEERDNIYLIPFNEENRKINDGNKKGSLTFRSENSKN